MSRNLLLPLLAASLAFCVSASTASAVTIEFGGADDPSLHGTTGSLSITGPIDAGTGTFDVEWSMDFAGYEGSASNHPYLTNITFKAFSSVSFISLDEIVWSVPTTGSVYYPSNINGQGGCVTGNGSEAGMVCVDLNSHVDATSGGEIVARFTVTGDLLADDWSYRGKFGTERGWVISESGSPIPEPTAATLFAVGLLLVGRKLRRA
jgi:hypothetical protein